MDDKKARSVTQSSNGVTVKASPFNEIKLELGIILLIALVILLSVEAFVADLGSQLLILAITGSIAMFWLMLRIRNVMHKIQNQPSDSEQ